MMRRPRLARFLVLAASACGSSPQESATASAGTTGIDATTSSTAASEGETSSSTGAPPGDPLYPPPDPIDAEGTCPDDTFGPITFDGSAWICIPECGEEFTCPAAETGTADAACATNPLSSGMTCDTSLDCTVDGEKCGNAGGGQKGCLLPPSHCILRCDEERVCADGMTCTAAGVCGYPP